MRWLKKNRRMLHLVSTSLNVLAIGTLLLWLVDSGIWCIPLRVAWEPLFALLTFSAVGLKEVYSRLASDFLLAPAVAVAAGYVENFLEPVVTELASRSSSPTILVAKVSAGLELTVMQIERIEAALKTSKYQIEIENLPPRGGRSFDIYRVPRLQESTLYLCFPTTLRSLTQSVSHILESYDHKPSSEKQRKRLERALYSKFYAAVKKLLTERHLVQYVKWVDSSHLVKGKLPVS